MKLVDPNIWMHNTKNIIYTCLLIGTYWTGLTEDWSSYCIISMVPNWYWTNKLKYSIFFLQFVNYWPWVPHGQFYPLKCISPFPISSLVTIQIIFWFVFNSISSPKSQLTKFYKDSTPYTEDPYRGSLSPIVFSLSWCFLLANTYYNDIPCFIYNQYSCSLCPIAEQISIHKIWSKRRTLQKRIFRHQCGWSSPNVDRKTADGTRIVFFLAASFIGSILP